MNKSIFEYGEITHLDGDKLKIEKKIIKTIDENFIEFSDDSEGINTIHLPLESKRNNTLILTIRNNIGDILFQNPQDFYLTKNVN